MPTFTDSYEMSSQISISWLEKMIKKCAAPVHELLTTDTDRERKNKVLQD